MNRSLPARFPLLKPFLRNDAPIGGVEMTFFREIFEGLKIAWDAIRANKLRSSLTTLGIVIGIISVSLMGTAIEGLNRAFNKAIASFGTDVLYIQKFTWSFEE